MEITPATRVADLLAARPDLEETLIRQAPAFAHLRNPVLRRTVGRVATLEMAARVGGIPVRNLVAALRREAGLEDTALPEGPAEDEAPPSWLDGAPVRATIDADALLRAGEVPLAPVVAALAGLGPGEVLVVSGGFEPAPLVDLLRTKGHPVHVRRAGPGRFETCVASRATAP